MQIKQWSCYSSSKLYSKPLTGFSVLSLWLYAVPHLNGLIHNCNFLTEGKNGFDCHLQFWSKPLSTHAVQCCLSRERWRGKFYMLITSWQSCVAIYHLLVSWYHCHMYLCPIRTNSVSRFQLLVYSFCRLATRSKIGKIGITFLILNLLQSIRTT